MTTCESKFDAKLNEEHLKITSWLNELGFSERPDYEINQELVEIVSLVMRTNQEMDKDRQLVVEDLEKRISEYEAESKRLGGDDILMPLMASEGSLSKDVLESSRFLAQLAVNLGLDDPSQTNCEFEMANLASNVLDAELKLERLESEIAIGTEKNKQLMVRITEHKKILESVTQDVGFEENRQAANEKELRFLSSKRSDYKRNIQQLEKVLEEFGMNPSLKHERLKQDFEHLESVQKEVVSLQSKLDGYKNIPADISLANVIIAEAKVRLQKLNDELDKHLNEI